MSSPLNDWYLFAAGAVPPPGTGVAAVTPILHIVRRLALLGGLNFFQPVGADVPY